MVLSAASPVASVWLVTVVIHRRCEAASVSRVHEPVLLCDEYALFSLGDYKNCVFSPQLWRLRVPNRVTRPVVWGCPYIIVQSGDKSIYE